MDGWIQRILYFRMTCTLHNKHAYRQRHSLVSTGVCAWFSSLVFMRRSQYNDIQYALARSMSSTIDDGGECFSWTDFDVSESIISSVHSNGFSLILGRAFELRSALESLIIPCVSCSSETSHNRSKRIHMLVEHHKIRDAIAFALHLDIPGNLLHAAADSTAISDIINNWK